MNLYGIIHEPYFTCEYDDISIACNSKINRFVNFSVNTSSPVLTLILIGMRCQHIGFGSTPRYSVRANHCAAAQCKMTNTEVCCRIYAYGIVRKARWADLSTSHHMKPEPLGECRRCSV